MIVFFEKKARVEFGTSDSSRCLDVVSCVVEEERAWCVRRFIAIPVFMFRPFAGFSGNRVSCVVNVLENTNLIDRVLGVVRARMEQPCKSPSFSAKAFYSPTFLFSVFFHFLSPLFSHVLSVSCSLSLGILWRNGAKNDKRVRLNPKWNLTFQPNATPATPATPAFVWDAVRNGFNAAMCARKWKRLHRRDWDANGTRVLRRQ
jgi:hypothetical protein